MTSLTAEALDLHGVNATAFDRMVAQVEHDGRGWVCGHTLRLPHIGGLAAAALARDFGNKPSTTYAYRLAPELWDRIVVGEARGRDAA